MVGRIAWVLNLDADDELARPEGYVPSGEMRERVRVMAARIPGLVAPEDVVLEPGMLEPAVDKVPRGLLAGRAWCPTPRALAILQAAGVEVPAAPPLEVLRAVNHRRFAAGLGSTLPGACFVESRAELDDAMAAEPFEVWRAKRPFTMAGRGHCRLHRGALGERETRWVERSLRDGDGLWVEPWVARELDLGVHGHVSAEGVLLRGKVTRQECDAMGAWRGSVVCREGELPDEWRSALEEEADGVAAALRAAGYFGPWGVDAFVWRDLDGERHLNPRCDVNARYTMGWSVGMEGRRL